MAYVTLDDDFDPVLAAAGDFGEGLCVPDDPLDAVIPYVSALDDKSCLKCLGFDVGSLPAGQTGEGRGFSGDGGGGPGCFDHAAGNGFASESAAASEGLEFDVCDLVTTFSEAVAVTPAGSGGGMVCSALPTLLVEGVGLPSAGMRPTTVPAVPMLPVEGVGQTSAMMPPVTVTAVPPSVVSTTTTATFSDCSLSSTSVESTPSMLTRPRRRQRTGHRKRNRCWSPQLQPHLLPVAGLDSGSDDNGNDKDSEYHYSSGGNGHGFAARHRSRQGRRQCTHCSTAETPQWRVGPGGPGTLCNACGIRYKMNRLLPEYRPSTSPSFVSSYHSNRHKNVLRIRESKVLEDITASLHCS